MSGKIIKQMLSTGNNAWATRWEDFNPLNEIFKFEIDVCAEPSTAKVEKFWTVDDNCLTKSWGKKVCYMNPPYGPPEKPCKTNCTKKRCQARGFHIDEYVPGQIDFVKKAYEEASKGAIVACLIPVRTGTEIWKKYVFKAEAILWYPGRLKFGGAKDPAPFESALVVFTPQMGKKPKKLFDAWYKHIDNLESLRNWYLWRSK